MESGTGSSSESSQNIVDELFKDFISKKISKTKIIAASKDTPQPAKVDEISKLLDLEISSIQAQTKDSSGKVKDASSSGNQNISCKSISVSQALSSELKNITVPDQNITADIPLPPVPSQETGEEISKVEVESRINQNGDSSSPSTTINNVESLPNAAKTVGPLAKKMNIPKQLGCKLSTESLSLIKSNEKIDRNGRLWEDGEVQSSNSDDSNKEDSESDDNDGYPSETGSINSDQDDWKSSRSSSSKHKKKHHKHKHKKKKKKKSSKEKEKSHPGDEGEKDRKKSKEKEKSKRSKKDKDDSYSTSSQKDKVDADRDKKSNDRVKENGDEKSRGEGSDSENSKRDNRRSLDEDKTDEKKREKEKKRKHDRSRSKSPKRSKRSKSRSRSPRKSKRTASPRRSRYSEWDARRYTDDSKKFSRSRSRSRSPGRSKRRRSPEKKRDRSSDRKRDRSPDRKWERSKEQDKDRDLRLQIDKAKLRKIAIANALNSMKSGQTVPVQLDVAAVKSGGKSVEELTDFCKRISEKEQEKVDNAISDSSEEETAVHTDDEEPLIHHPFKVKDTSANIVMNIRNAKQLPVMTPSEKQAQQASLRLAFPVSSGSHHRANESEWVPVEKTTVQTTTTTSKTVDTTSMAEPQPKAKDSIFPSNSGNVDIGAIISERLQAVRKLQANPYDVQALSTMHKAQEKASQWAQSKHLPGQFIGSTGAQVMSQEEIMGDKRRQAWVKKVVTREPIHGHVTAWCIPVY